MFDMVFFSFLADKINYMNYLALGISYRGNAYCGWQRQRHRADTVQETLEKA
ncbi:MAG: tRNA pseudouridine(38-40) synthase TruA, partial [Gammaproteobacteria bacterium]